MQALKVFIASSDELKKQRNQLVGMLTKKTLELQRNQEGIYVDPVVWEEMSQGFADGPKQKDFNKQLIDCDVVVVLIWTKVGDFTKEEFDLAYKNFQNKKGRIKEMFVYFFDGAIKPSNLNIYALNNFKKVIELREEVQKYEQFYIPISTTKKLTESFNQQISLILRKKKIILKVDKLYLELNKVKAEIKKSSKPVDRKLTRKRDKISIEIRELEKERDNLRITQY